MLVLKDLRTNYYLKEVSYDDNEWIHTPNINEAWRFRSSSELLEVVTDKTKPVLIFVRIVEIKEVSTPKYEEVRSI